MHYHARLGEEGEEGEEGNETDSQSKWECAIAVTEVMSSLSESASFLSASASDCISGVSQMAYCAADITALVGALSQVANVVSGVNISCNSNETLPEDIVDNGGRRLQGRPLAASLPPVPPKTVGLKPGGPMPKENFLSIFNRIAKTGRAGESKDLDDIVDMDAMDEFAKKKMEEIEARDRRLEVAECVVDVNQGLSALLRSGLAINEARKMCKPDALVTEKARRICTVDVSGAIGSFTFAAEYFSFAASHCPEGLNSKAECSGEIAELTTAMASFAAVGAAIPLSCDPRLKKFDEGVPPDRRLAVGNSEAAAVST